MIGRAITELLAAQDAPTRRVRPLKMLEQVLADRVSDSCRCMRMWNPACPIHGQWEAR